ncbi:MAG TPA: DUF5681 domain-containing protein [Flavisolibacter sp.]|nr:DUF5681 domain-containing protein [Flavisolibacter sp.]
MPFPKGQSGNPNGRPKGAINKTSSELRDRIALFLDDNFEVVQKEFDTLTGKDKVRFYTDLLQYGVPKMQSMSLSPDYENMSDEQLDQIINGLIEKSR